MRLTRLSEDFIPDSDAGGWLSRYPDAYIHFTRVQKLGVNPSAHKLHRDVNGIYFYPASWFLSGAAKPEQYGINMPYYYLVEINRSSNGVILNTITIDEVRSIAKRNGWSAPLEEAIADPTKLISAMGGQSGHKTRELVKQGHAGALFYHVPDAMFHDPEKFGLDHKVNRTSMYRGVDYIEDTGEAIIHEHEPAQLVTLTPKAIANVIHFGEVSHNHHRGIRRRLATWFRENGFEVSFKNKVMTALKRADPYFKISYHYVEGNDRIAPSLIYEYYDKVDGRFTSSTLRLDDSWSKPVIYDSDKKIYVFDNIITTIRNWMSNAGEASANQLLWTKIRYDVDRVMNYSYMDDYRIGSLSGYIQGVVQMIPALKGAEVPKHITKDHLQHGAPSIPIELIRKVYVHWKTELSPEEIDRSNIVGELSTVIMRQMVGSRWDTEASRKERLDQSDEKYKAVLDEYQDQLQPRCEMSVFIDRLYAYMISYDKYRYEERVAKQEISDDEFKSTLDKFLAGTFFTR
jgi:hypothetical protein